MDPATIATIVSFALKYGPELALELTAIFKKPDPTIADIEALFTKVRDYAAIIASAKAKASAG